MQTFKKNFSKYDTNNKCIIQNNALVRVIYTELNVLQYVLNVSQVVRVSVVATVFFSLVHDGCRTLFYLRVFALVYINTKKKQDMSNSIQIEALKGQSHYVLQVQLQKHPHIITGNRNIRSECTHSNRNTWMCAYPQLWH